jgi:hypothetical protein
VPSLTDPLDYLSWLQASVSSIVQWLQKYKAGYLVVVLIGARITWRIYRSMASRREKTNRTMVPTQAGHAALGAVQEIVRKLEADP